MVVKDTKTSQNMESKSWLNIEKILQNEKKRHIIIIRNYFCLESLICFLSVGLV